MLDFHVVSYRLMNICVIGTNDYSAFLSLLKKLFLIFISLMHLAVCRCCAVSGCWSYLGKSLEHHWNGCFNWPGFEYASWRKGEATSPQFSSCDNPHSSRMGWNICKVCICYLCQILNKYFVFFFSLVFKSSETLQSTLII